MEIEITCTARRCRELGGRGSELQWGKEFREGQLGSSRNGSIDLHTHRDILNDDVVGVRALAMICAERERENEGSAQIHNGEDEGSKWKPQLR